MFADAGLEVSHPFLDRDLIEFVASIEPTSRPLGTSNKTLIRTAYRDLLPDAVIDLRRKVLGNPLFEAVFSHYARDLTDRFPTVPAELDQNLSETDYQRLKESAKAPIGSISEHVALWSTWSVFLWLDTSTPPK